MPTVRPALPPLSSRVGRPRRLQHPRVGRWRPLATLLLGWLLAGTAHAGPGGWRWDEGTTRRYLVESIVVLPRSTWLIARNNDQGRADGFHVRAVVSCASSGVTRSGTWKLGCTIDDAVLAVQAYEPDSGKLEPVVAEYVALLRAGRIELELSPDGRAPSAGSGWEGACGARCRPPSP